MDIVYNFDDLDLSKSYTYADYLKWHFKERVELIRGFIAKMTIAPNLSHQRVSANLSGCLYINFRQNSCEFFAAPFDVRLPIASAKKDSTVIQPDFCVVCDASKLDSNGCNGAPDLAIEIISQNNSKHDSVTKFKLYQEAGVKEYWIIDPLEKLLNVYSLQNGKYIGLPPQSEGEKIKSNLFPELNIALDDVFENL